MTPTDYDIALLVQDLYQGGKLLDRVMHVAGVDVGIKSYANSTVLIHEGSHDLPDWERDFHASMIKVVGLGGVPQVSTRGCRRC